MYPEIEKLQSLLGSPLLEVVLESSAASVILAEAPSGKILYINSAVRKFRGPTEAPLDGILIEDYVLSWRLLYPDGTPMESEEVPLARSILHDENVVNEELIVELDNGDRRWALVNCSPIKDRTGATVAGIASWLDITDYKNAQILLEEARSEIKELRGIIPICCYCHEIRDGQGCWERFEAYITKHSDVSISHSVCPKCLPMFEKEVGAGI